MRVDHSATHRRVAGVLLAVFATAVVGCGSSGSSSSSSSELNDGHDWQQASLSAKKDAVDTCQHNFGSSDKHLDPDRVRDAIDSYYESGDEDSAFNTACLDVLTKMGPKAKPKVDLFVSHGAEATVTSDSYTLRGTVGPASARVSTDSSKAHVTRRGYRFSIDAQLQKGDNDFKIVATAAGHRAATITAAITRKETPEQIAAEEAQAKTDFENASATISYGELEKDASGYRGKRIKVYGQVFQIQQSGNGGIMLVSVTDEGYGEWDDNIWVDYTGKVPQVEGDLITLYGTVTGSKSYQTQIGGRTYVPRVRAKYIDGT